MLKGIISEATKLDRNLNVKEVQVGSGTPFKMYINSSKGKETVPPQLKLLACMETSYWSSHKMAGYLRWQQVETKLPPTSMCVICCTLFLPTAKGYVLDHHGNFQGLGCDAGCHSNTATFPHLHPLWSPPQKEEVSGTNNQQETLMNKDVWDRQQVDWDSYYRVERFLPSIQSQALPLPPMKNTQRLRQANQRSRASGFTDHRMQSSTIQGHILNVEDHKAVRNIVFRKPIWTNPTKGQSWESGLPQHIRTASQGAAFIVQERSRRQKRSLSKEVTYQWTGWSITPTG